MNEIKVRKDTQLQYKHYLLTDTPGGWKRSKWERVVRNTKKTYDGMSQGKPFICYTGEVKILGTTWVVSHVDGDNADDGSALWWLHAPKDRK